MDFTEEGNGNCGMFVEYILCIISNFASTRYGNRLSLPRPPRPFRHLAISPGYGERVPKIRGDVTYQDFLPKPVGRALSHEPEVGIRGRQEAVAFGRVEFATVPQDRSIP